MKHKRIVIDVDGVLADFIQGFTALAGQMFRGVPVTRTYEKETWDGYPGLTETQIAQVWDVVNKSTTFWASLSPLITLQEARRISTLHNQEYVYFCTARVGADAKAQTERWLREHGIVNPTVVISKRKGEFCKAVDADVAIDDKAGNASFIDWGTEGRTKSYLLDRPYNRVPQEFLASGVRRVHSLTEFLDNIQEG